METYKDCYGNTVTRKPFNISELHSELDQLNLCTLKFAAVADQSIELACYITIRESIEEIQQQAKADNEKDLWDLLD